MNTIDILTLVLLVAAFAGLVHLVHHDGFAVPRTQKRDELGVACPPRYLG